MSETTASEKGPARGGGHFGVAVIAAVVVLCAFQLWWALDIRGQVRSLAEMRAETADQMRELEDLSARLETAALKIRGVSGQIQRIEQQLEPLVAMGNDWDIVVGDLTNIDSKLSKLVVAFENQFGTEVDRPAPQVPDLDWTQPELYQAARRAAESVGISLGDGEVRVPCRVVLREGLLEYFAVLKGGREHEALISLVGNTPADQRRPMDFGAKLNNAIQALGFKRGKPIRFTPTGTRPAQGQPVYLFLEWEEDGKTVVVRAEDLVWNRRTGKTMERGRWVYVGSSYVPGDEDGSAVFAADLTAEAVATYSAVNTIIDNTSDGAADDTVFLVASPRLPEDVEIMTFVIRIEDREPSRTFEELVGSGDDEQDRNDGGRPEEPDGSDR